MNNIFKGKNRVFEILHQRLIKTSSESEKQTLFQVVDLYQDFLKFHDISIGESLDYYSRFMDQYSADLNSFEKNRLYPFQLEDYQFEPSRIEYDIALILSVLISQHRLKIIDSVSQFKPKKNSKIAFIGVGPGIELKIAESWEHCTIDAFDTSLSEFAKNRFKGSICLKEEKFDPGKNYDAVFAIEILEHVKNPQALLGEITHSLAPGGMTVFTTATNIPQFDHLYNFDNSARFEEICDNLGLNCKNSLFIDHNLRGYSFQASNSFYVFEKR